MGWNGGNREGRRDEEGTGGVAVPTFHSLNGKVYEVISRIMLQSGVYMNVVMDTLKWRQLAND